MTPLDSGLDIIHRHSGNMRKNLLKHIKKVSKRRRNSIVKNATTPGILPTLEPELTGGFRPLENVIANTGNESVLVDSWINEGGRHGQEGSSD